MAIVIDTWSLEFGHVNIMVLVWFESNFPKPFRRGEEGLTEGDAAIEVYVRDLNVRSVYPLLIVPCLHTVSMFSLSLRFRLSNCTHSGSDRVL